MSKPSWIYEANGVAAAYIAARTQTVFSHEHHGWLCLSPTGQLLGAVLLHDYDPHQSLFSLALTPGARITPTDLRRLCEAAFNQQGVSRIEMRTNPLNEPATRMAKVFGMMLEGTRRNVNQNGDDENIWGLLKAECRWLTRPKSGEPHGRSSTNAGVPAPGED